MGCFSWKYANTLNEKRLRIDKPAYLYCPNGTIIHEPCYEGYGEFGGQDVYELVADWNRQFLANHPNFRIPMPGGGSQPVKDFFWYKAYADLSKTKEMLEQEVRDPDYPDCKFEYRHIGIEIACYDCQNAALPFPIKICSSGRGLRYSELPPSQSDPNQGF